MHTGTGWVGDNNVRTSVFSNKLVGEDILHITSVEQSIVNAVNFTVDFSIFDGFRYIFNTNHLTGLTCNEIGDGTSAGIEVVNNFVTRQIGKLASDAVEVVCLFGICLIERLWTDFELQVLHQFIDMVVTLECENVLIADGIVALLVIQIHQRCNLWEFVGNMLHQVHSLLFASRFVVVELEDNHPFARG